MQKSLKTKRDENKTHAAPKISHKKTTKMVQKSKHVTHIIVYKIYICINIWSTRSIVAKTCTIVESRMEQKIKKGGIS